MAALRPFYPCTLQPMSNTLFLQAAAQQALAWERAAQALQRLATDQRAQAVSIVLRAGQVCPACPLHLDCAVSPCS